MNIENGIIQVKALLNSNYMVKKHDVHEDLKNDKPRVAVRLSCVNVIDNVSDLTNLMRVIRQRIPASYAVVFTIKTVC